MNDTNGTNKAIGWNSVPGTSAKRGDMAFRTVIILGAVGLLDFLSGFVMTPFVEKEFGISADVPITFLTAVYMDVSASAVSMFAPLLLVLTKALNGLWPLFLLAALALYTSRRKTPSKPSEPQDSLAAAYDWIGFKSLSPASKWIVIAILASYFIVAFVLG